MIDNNKLPDWNKDQVWDKVNDRLHKKKRRGIFFWWFFGGTATVLVGLILWMNYSTPQQSEITVNTEIEEPILETNKSTSEESSKTTIDSKTQNLNNTEPVIDKNLSAKNNLEKVNSSTEIFAQNQSIKKYKSTINAPSNQLKSNEEDALKFIDSKQNDIVIKDSNYKNVFENSTIEINQIDSTKLELNQVSLDYLNMLPIQLFDFEYHDLELDSKQEIESYPTILDTTKIRSSLNWYVESGIGIGKLHKADIRNTETFRFSQTNTLGFEKYIHRNIKLNLGLSYQTFYHKYESTTLAFTEQAIASDSAIVYNLGNEIQHFEPGELYQTTENRRSIIHNNFVNRWSIPISVGYNFRFNKIDIIPSIGIRTRFSQKFNGIITEDNQHLFDEELINETYYSNQFDFGLMGSLSIRYNFNNKSALGIGARIEIENAINLYDIPPVQRSRYETLGIHVGYYRSF